MVGGLLSPQMMGAPQRMQPQGQMPGQYPAPPRPMAQAPGAGMMQSIGDRFLQFTQQNPGALGALGAGLMAGNPAAGMAQANQLVAGSRERNKTLEFLQQNDPDLAAAVEAGMPVGDAFATYYQRKNPPRAEPTASMREYELARQQGFGGSFLDYETATRRAGATNIDLNMGEGDKFYETLDSENAKVFAEIGQAGVEAGARMQQIDRLESLLGNAPQGAAGRMRQLAGEWGLAVEGLDDVQAAQALINQLVPQQRPPGSGPMSDADLELFKQSLPRIINTSGGNQFIIQTMRQIAQYQVQMAEIADQVADRVISPSQGREAMRALQNPLADFNRAVGRPSAPAGGGGGNMPADFPDPALWEHLSPEERALWQN